MRILSLARKCHHMTWITHQKNLQRLRKWFPTSHSMKQLNCRPQNRWTRYRRLIRKKLPNEREPRPLQRHRSKCSSRPNKARRGSRTTRTRPPRPRRRRTPTARPPCKDTTPTSSRTCRFRRTSRSSSSTSPGTSRRRWRSRRSSSPSSRTTYPPWERSTPSSSCRGPTARRTSWGSRCSTSPARSRRTPRCWTCSCAPSRRRRPCSPPWCPASRTRGRTPRRSRAGCRTSRSCTAATRRPTCTTPSRCRTSTRSCRCGRKRWRTRCTSCSCRPPRSGWTSRPTRASCAPSSTCPSTQGALHALDDVGCVGRRRAVLGDIRYAGRHGVRWATEHMLGGPGCVYTLLDALSSAPSSSCPSTRGGPACVGRACAGCRNVCWRRRVCWVAWDVLRDVRSPSSAPL
mmetsp:Transcript_76176/g.204500  ORF Transcript_76176/g.204500 Transcript_76176/m.204500 type:complete len:402 (-) Transcript_76176:6-1211(-)